MTVLLPENPSAAGHPTLYLLHGLSDDDTVWLRRTSIERYAAPLGLAVVMPQVARSFYTDEAHGNRYWTFLSEELPHLVRSFFHVSDRREDTFVAGLSMGGYGAMKWALREPDRFAAAASLSGALDMAMRQRRGGPPEDPERFHRIFGDRPVAGTEDDLGHLIHRIGDIPALPRLYLSCGTGDPLYKENRSFRETCRAKGIPLTVHFGPGRHEWSYWDARIQDVLAWLPIRAACSRGRGRGCR